MSIVLIGMPGSGKTTVSRILSKNLNLDVVDTDELIVRKYGAICDIFEQLGEQAFRNFETEIVKEVASCDKIISVGGGCVMREENIAAFRAANAKIIYLRAGLQTLAGRLSGDDNRPLLKGNAEEKLKKLLDERAEIYEFTADFTVDTDGVSPEDVAKKIAENLP